ncbi:MAG: hypothetical protein WEB93_07525 [Sphingomonadales bacterium]
MSKLEYYYAVPEHLVIRELIPDIDNRRLAGAAARDAIANNPGVVPVGIDPDEGGTVFWADIGDYPFREWQFLYTIDHLAKAGRIGMSFTTALDALRDPEIATRGLAPRGFIFHVSRCGSTVLGKALARADENVVINQGGPLQHGFWALVTDNWSRPPVASDENLHLFRQVVLALTRQRQPGQRNAFVKFISWNTLCMDFIFQAFPDVPAVFLYRDAAEVIASVRKNTTAALEARGTSKGIFIAGNDQNPDAVKYLTNCYSKYFDHALDAVERGLNVVNYRNINGDNARHIMGEGLGYEPDPETWSGMRGQFDVYSKDDTDKTVFTSDEAAKQSAIPDEDRAIIDASCRDLADRLDDCPGNLFPRQTRHKDAYQL